MSRPESGPHPRRNLGLLLTTTLLLLVSRLLLRTVGEEATARALDGLARLGPPYGTVEPDRIGWAVAGVASRLPLSFSCLMQALAGRSLLGAHGHHGVVCYGVTSAEGDLRAHAWVRQGERVLIGDLDELGEYRLLYERPTGGTL